MFQLTQYKTTRWVTCDYDLRFDYPDTVYTNSSSAVSCRAAGWPKKTAIDYTRKVKMARISSLA